MECPECGYKTSVQDSRPYMGTRYRKRLCVSCGLIFWTVEDIADPAEVEAIIIRNMNEEEMAYGYGNR